MQLNQREFFGTVPDQLRQLDEYILINVRQPLEMTGSTHTRTPDYPVDALVSFIRNALMHRAYKGTNSPVRVNWYSDRVEITLAGRPIGQVTTDNFGEPGVTDYRNPTLAAFLKDLGFVERFGLGIALAKQALKANGNPAPEFTISGTHVHITVRAAQ